MKDLERLQNKKDENPTKKSLGHRRNLLVLTARVKTFMHSIIIQDPSFLLNVLYLSILFLCIGWGGFSILSFYAVEIFQLSGSPLPALNTS